jgi:hypothetical protein
MHVAAMVAKKPELKTSSRSKPCFPESPEALSMRE